MELNLRQYLENCTVSESVVRNSGSARSILKRIYMDISPEELCGILDSIGYSKNSELKNFDDVKENEYTLYRIRHIKSDTQIIIVNIEKKDRLLEVDFYKGKISRIKLGMVNHRSGEQFLDTKDIDIEDLIEYLS